MLAVLDVVAVEVVVVVVEVVVVSVAAAALVVAPAGTLGKTADEIRILIKRSFRIILSFWEINYPPTPPLSYIST